jgi:hypothetical protein
MVLRLSTEEAEMMKRALLDQIASLRQQANRYSAPYSATGIALCQQRARAEELLDRIENPSRELGVVEPTRRAA